MNFNVDTSFMENIQNHPLYEEALKAHSLGDSKKFQELMDQFYNDPNIKQYVDSSIKERSGDIKQMFKDQGFTVISKDEPLPEGYNRNSFSPTTCINVQQRDLPEWKEIIAQVEFIPTSHISNLSNSSSEYKTEIVYEDHEMIDQTSDVMLNSICKKYTGIYTGRIKSSSTPIHTLNKFKKNMLSLIINKLFITLENVNYSVIEVLKFFENNKTYKKLEEIIIEHSDKEYNLNEIKDIKKLFAKTSWNRIKFANKFEITK